MASPDSSSPSTNRDSTFSFTLLITFSVPTLPFTQTELGCLPASKESIKAMESVVISGGDVVGNQCAVCLEEWRAGDVARMMPCNHKFHGDCIKKWLGVHRSCPVCRYEMPPEEKDAGKKSEGEVPDRVGTVGVYSIDFGSIFSGRSNLGESGESSDADSSDVIDTEED